LIKKETKKSSAVAPDYNFLSLSSTEDKLALLKQHPLLNGDFTKKIYNLTQMHDKIKVKYSSKRNKF